MRGSTRVRRATSRVSIASAPGAIAGEGGVALLSLHVMSGTVDLAGTWARFSLVWGLLIGLILGAGFGAGCAAGPVDYARAYPENKEPAQTINVQVFRREDHISFTNTSPYDFGPSTLWVNAAYSRPIDALHIGQTVDLSLHDFRNEHSQPFRAGGFFATELPSKLVLAEIESGDRLYGLIVVEDRAQ